MSGGFRSMPGQTSKGSSFSQKAKALGATRKPPTLTTSFFAEPSVRCEVPGLNRALLAFD